MITTVIFDLDGLLADSETLHCKAYQDTLGSLGVTISEAEYAEFWIRRGLGINEFAGICDADLDTKEVRRRKAIRFQELVDTALVPMPGALDVVQRLHGHKRLALATGSYAADAMAIIDRLDLTKNFEYIATKESTPRLKPHPDPWLHVAEQLDVTPAECVILEDAQKGILAAVAADMRSICIPNRFTRNTDLSQATIRLEHLDEVTLELIDSLADHAI